MSETLESMKRKLDGAKELEVVVRAMKAISASNIGQYEMAVNSLADYYHTIALGISACLKKEKLNPPERSIIKDTLPVIAIVFGSDQGLVGQFNDTVSAFTSQTLDSLPGKKEIWVVGERVQSGLSDAGFNTAKLFYVPNSVNSITKFIGHILTEIEGYLEKDTMKKVYIFHNRPQLKTGYEPVAQRLLPFDKMWRDEFNKIQWPTKTIPQIIGKDDTTLKVLIREYIFVSLYKACAESLLSENSSRLNAMQRAEQNIKELLDDLTLGFNRMRQNSIDEELFDLISGFEALKRSSI